ncbi:MAG: T9SS type A sorting domain-containing protein [Bacteroidales bacterium]|nr:T9SS type A sorting domain-containing protein [Bacteroidales bacterium]
MKLFTVLGIGGLVIYPCPATDYAVLKLHSPLLWPSQLKIISLNGDLICQFNVEAGESEIRLDLDNAINSGMKSGLYFVIFSNETQAMTGKLLITGR